MEERKKAFEEILRKYADKIVGDKTEDWRHLLTESKYRYDRWEWNNDTQRWDNVDTWTKTENKEN